jgi:hypothetical protein
MKKIATVLAAAVVLVSGFAVATPAVLACPHEEKQVNDKAEKQEPQTADKDKAKKDDTVKKDTAKKDGETPKTDDGKVSRK